MKGDIVENSIFLDSGAFSAFTKNVEIDIQEYIAFIKKYKKYLTAYAVLDVIGDPKGTYKNQRIMESAGLSPIPCYHYGEDTKWLEKYIDNYEYIALGGMVPIGTSDLKDWLDTVFSKFICGEDGLPKVKVHGFGMTVITLMLRYPWYSVDSTSWLMTGRFGGVLIPHRTKGNSDYHKIPLKITFSNRPSTPDKFNYNNGITPLVKEYVDNYLKENNIIVGNSTFDNEGVETIIESGLSNDYKERDKANIIFFLNMEKSLPEYPWAFKLEKRIGKLSL